jgi:hypothetical protein
MDEEKKLQLMHEFRSQLVFFLDELIEQFPSEGDFVIIRIFIKDQIPVYDVIGRFIRDLLPLKEKVQTRDQSFFLENTLLYTGGNVATDKINHFKELWLSKQLDDTDREVIWKWMDLFISIAHKYYKAYGYIPGWTPTTQLNEQCFLTT